MRIVIFIFIMLMLNLRGFCNGMDFDEYDFKKNEVSIDSIQKLNTLSRDLVFVDPDQSLGYANLSLKLSTELNYQDGIANAYRILSAIYSYRNSYYLSMDYINRSLDIFQEANDSVGIANCYISLGHIYRKLQKWDQEVVYHRKSFEIFKRLNMSERIGVASHNLGEGYYNLKDYVNARRLTELSIAVNDSLGNLSVLSSCYKVKGLIALAEEDYEKAEESFNEVVRIADRLGEQSQKVAVIESILGLAMVDKETRGNQNYRDRLLFASEYSSANELSSYLLAATFRLLEYAIEEGDINAASTYFEIYESLNDSINAQLAEDRYNLTNTVLEVYRLSKQKKTLEEDNLLKSQQVSTLVIVGILILLSSVVVVWFLLKFVRLNQNLKAQKSLIEVQNEELAKLNETKNKFFSIVAHDLKSPLLSLEGFSNLMLKHFDRMSKDQIQIMSRDLRQQVTNTIKMTENLITWAMMQMNDHSYNPENLSLSEVCKDIEKVYRDVATQKGLNFKTDFEKDLTLYGDKNQIKFILRNVVNNAIKFTKENGLVSLTAVRVGDNVQVSIKDTGIGMSDEKKKELFKLGKNKSKEGTGGEKGTGLGLMLVWEFLKLNKGSVSLESTVGVGSVFTLTFPIENSI